MFETELRALLEKATPGPWEREGRGECWVAAPHTKLGSVPVVVPHVRQAVGDLDLIVHLRNNAEGLAVLVEAARAMDHRQDEFEYSKSQCVRCWEPWPCPSWEALAALDAGEASTP